MRILIPTADFPPIEGGISTVTLQVARELTKLGHEVTVIAPRFRGMSEFDAAEPYSIVRYSGYWTGWLRFIPMLAVSARFLHASDLVLGINIAYGGVIGMMAARRSEVPYVAFGYAFEFMKFAAWSPPAALLRAAYNRAHVVVAISGFTRDALVRFGVHADRIETILPGAPPAREVAPVDVERVKQRLSLNGHRIVFAAGRMMPRKGHATLVRALPKIIERHPDTMLVCAGRGPAMGEVERAVDRLGLRDHVRLPGRLTDEDLAALYSMCDVFALPAGEGSRGQVEGFGLVFAEAGAYGKPVVAGRSGGTVDAVLDGRTGILVEPNDPAASAEAILRLLDDPALARRLGDAGRDRVAREINWSAFTRRMMDAVERRSGTAGRCA